jgi:hypothetical protein
MNKKIVAIAIVLLAAGVWAPLALAMDPMGPPAAGLGKGKWSIGAEYSYSEMTFQRQPVNWGHAKRTVDTRLHKVYSNLGYGLSENVDVFTRLGFASLETLGTIGGGNWKGDGSGNWDFVWGGGIKATLSESSDVSWGFLAQFSEGDLSGDEKGRDDEAGNTGNYEVKLDEIQLAVGPTWKAAEGVKIYGGPFVQLIRGRWDDKFDGDRHFKPIEESSWLGAYIGAALELAANTSLTVEYQYTPDAYAVAGGICWKF